MRFWFFGFLLLVLAAISLWWKGEYDQTNRYNHLIAEASAKYDIHPDFVRAVIWRESAFDERATGLAKERGLMQVTPVAGQEWASAENLKNFKPEDLFDPKTNIQAGAWYLSRARKRWLHTDEPEIFALAEYNAGRSNALRWAKGLSPLTGAAFHSRVDFPTTKAYIRDILKQYHLYRTESAPGPFETFWNRILRRVEKVRLKIQKERRARTQGSATE